MSFAIEALRAQPQLGPPEIGAFVRQHEFPIVEGSRVTFVYVGPADQVSLRHWIFGLDASQPFTRVQGTSLWFHVLDVPEGSRVEYKLEIVRGAERRLIQDPLNPHLARDPYGANSVVYGEGYQRPDWTWPDPEARAGTLEEITVESAAFGEARPLLVYLPARFRPRRRYPLLVVHDGLDYLRYCSLKTVLDNLVHRDEVEGLVVALTSSPDRLREYADDERHATHLAHELVPALEERFPLVREPYARCLAGASFGAVASLAAAWRNPGFFGSALLQSGSFVFTDIGAHERGPVFDPVVRFVNEFRAAPGRPLERVFLTCGTYESSIYYNRSLVPLLQSTGMSVRYAEARDGHNWENWRDRLREALSWLFPGPLWMVYE